MNFYASLNSSQICEQIIVTPRKLDGPAYIDIENYNDSLIWRRWDGKQWSNEKYEPSNNEILNQISTLERQVRALENSLKEKSEEESNLKKYLVESKEIDEVNIAALIELNGRVLGLEGK